MNYIINLKKVSPMLKKALPQLKKEGDQVVQTLPTGTTVAYIRGANFEARGFGPKYKLYKEITKPDGTRYVTNANVIREDVYINEVFYIKPNYKGIPDYVMWCDKKYNMSPGSRGYTVTSDVKGFNYPKILQDLLRKKVEPRGTSYSSAGDSFRRSASGGAGQTYNRYNAGGQSGAYSGGYSGGYSGRTGNTGNTGYNYNNAGRNSGNSYNSGNTGYNNRTSSNTGGATGATSQTAKMSREDFIKHMDGKLSRYSKINPSDVSNFSDAEVRNLAKLFGTTEDKIRKMDRTTYRQLCLKWHPDKNKAPEATQIFGMLGKFVPQAA